MSQKSTLEKHFQRKLFRTYGVVRAVQYVWCSISALNPCSLALFQSPTTVP